MAYIIDDNGNKVQINMETNTTKSITIYPDDIDFCEDIYLLNLYSSSDSLKTNNELVAQIRLNKEPTREQILKWFSQYNLGNMDFYTIEKGKRLGWI